MKKIKIAVIVILTVLAILAPLSYPLIPLVTESVYSDNFVAALDDKMELLKNTQEEKIVIIGGSSVAFGIDSEIIETYTGMSVVNFGLYASLGSKLMIDLSRDYINEGDIVILAPELDRQTLSLYFSASVTLRAFENNLFKYISDIPSEHYASLFGASWDFATNKIKYLRTEKPKYDGVYNSSNFNKYGDIEYHRPENVMTFYYDMDNEIELTEDILSDNFADYVNEYTAQMRSRGAEVYFTYCPINSMALSDAAYNGGADAFDAYMRDRLDATFISSLGDYILPANYFYDTNFHLNDTGSLLRTVRLTEDILMELSDATEVKTKIPPMPSLPGQDILFDGEDENAEYFLYEQMDNGAYMLTGVKEEYRGEKQLTVPLGYNGKKVSVIGSRAFADTALERLMLTADTNIRYFKNDALAGAYNLKSMTVLYPYEADIRPPADFSTVGANFVIYIPKGSAYDGGYFWGTLDVAYKYV